MNKLTIRCILVDDEPLSRVNLRDLLAHYCPEVTIVGEASSAAEALQLINQHSPDLLFLDIEMNGPSGFDLLKSLNTEHRIEVIFVTAFDQYGIQAAKVCALDYLLKPIDIFELSAAVAKSQKQIALLKENVRLKELVANIDRNDDDKRIALQLAEKIEFVPVTRIIRLEADGNYTHFILENQKRYLVSRTLKEYDELLAGGDFLRTHQSHLVNCKKITAYVKSEGGYITMEDGSQVPISRMKKEEVLKRIIR